MAGEYTTWTGAATMSLPWCGGTRCYTDARGPPPSRDGCKLCRQQGVWLCVRLSCVATRTRTRSLGCSRGLQQGFHSGPVQQPSLRAAGAGPGVLRARRKQALTPRRAPAQEGCEFLFRQLDDGRLDLRDAFVYYPDADMYLRPQPPRGLPEAPTHFEELEWAAEYTGDIMFGKPPYSRVRRPAAARPPAAPGPGACAKCTRLAVQAGRAPRTPRPLPGRHRVRRGSARAAHAGQLCRPWGGSRENLEGSSGRAGAVPRHWTVLHWPVLHPKCGRQHLARSYPTLPYATWQHPPHPQTRDAPRRWSACT